MLQYVSILLEAHRARTDERGASAVEYGLLVAAVAAAVIAAMLIFGPVITNLFQGTADTVNGN
jgi:pilus assembly protein Flp/PilA